MALIGPSVINHSANFRWERTNQKQRENWSLDRGGIRCPRVWLRTRRPAHCEASAQLSLGVGGVRTEEQHPMKQTKTVWSPVRHTFGTPKAPGALSSCLALFYMTFRFRLRVSQRARPCSHSHCAARKLRLLRMEVT